MTLNYSNDRAGDGSRDGRRRDGFIRWSTPARSQAHNSVPDPGFVVDRRQLYKYLDSLEGLSGE